MMCIRPVTSHLFTLSEAVFIKRVLNLADVCLGFNYEDAHSS